MPGDAFYTGFCDRNHLKTWTEQQEISLAYVQPETTGTFNGVCGFSTLKVKHFTPEVANRLNLVLAAYEERVAAAKQRGQNPFAWSIFEAPPPRLLVYNKDFDIRRDSLFLKYNESWMNLAKQFPQDAHRPINTEYSSFVPDNAQSILEDWRLSERIPGLKVDVPQDAKWWIKWKPVEPPVSIDMNDIKIVIPMLGPPSDYYKLKKRVEIYVLTAEQLEHLRFTPQKEGGWAWKVEVVE